MELELIRSFLIVCKYRSISKAAEELYTSRQALTVSVNKLEKELDVKLLRRNHAGVEMTPAGEYLCANGSAILSQWDGIVTTLKKTYPQRELIRIGFGGLSKNLFSLPKMMEYEQRTPNVELSIHELPTTDCWSRLASHQLDLVVSIHPDPAFHLQKRFLFSNTAVLLIAKENPYSKKSSIVLEDFAHMQLLTVLNANPFGKTFMASHNFTPHFRVCSYSTALELVSLNKGVIILAKVLADEACARLGTITTVPLDPVSCDIDPNSYLLARDFSMLTEAQENFCAYLAQHVLC